MFGLIENLKKKKKTFGTWHRATVDYQSEILELLCLREW